MKSQFNRRDFNKLTAAAMGGLVTGSLATGASAADKPKHDPKLLLKEPHVCRGLNVCKSKGADKKNACAGMGACATAEKHECHTHNKCKGQGGCGDYPGQNACKEQGECAVPLGKKAWAKARKSFEAEMKKAGKKVGPAPKK